MPNQRLLAIDVLRGLTVAFMILVNTPGSWAYVYAPLLHASWHGCTPTDLVFPFFCFVVGLSMAYSFGKMTLANSSLLAKSLQRAGLIMLIGLALNWYPFYTKNIADLRFFGVLQRIGLAYGMASVLVIFSPRKLLPFLAVSLLVFYTLCLLLGNPADPFGMNGNIARSLDLAILGQQHMYMGFEWNGAKIPLEPEGLLATLGTLGTILIGYLVGKNLQNNSSTIQKCVQCVQIGVFFIVLGYGIHLLGLPLNKPLWTASYVYFTAGIATAVLACCLYVVDVLGYVRWSFPFQVFGMNALLSFVLSGLLIKTMNLFKIGELNLHNWVYQNATKLMFGPYLGSLISALLYTILLWLIAYFLYKRKIFVKV
jgi:predicted acyltransferase